jgi:hypothetical protein
MPTMQQRTKRPAIPSLSRNEKGGDGEVAVATKRRIKTTARLENARYTHRTRGSFILIF